MDEERPALQSEPEMSPLKAAAYEAFKKEHAQLLKTRYGQCAVYHGCRRLGFARTGLDIWHKWVKQGLLPGEITIFSIEEDPTMAHCKANES